MRGGDASHFIMPFILRRHWPAFVLALLVGLFLVRPALVARFWHDIPFSAPSGIRIADELLYFARVREVLDGHSTIGNPYLAEHKSKPPSPVFLGEWLTAGVSRLTGADVVAAGAALDFLLPALAALLTYACFLAVTGGRLLAFTGTALVFFGLFPSDFGRSVSPQLNFLFWLSEFLLLWRLMVGPPPRRPRLLCALAAVNFGALFYLYTYYWTFYLAFFLLAAVLFSYRGFRREVARTAGIAVGGLVLAIPYFLMMMRAIALPEYWETLRRVGLIETHFPSGIEIMLAALALLTAFAAFRWRRILEFNQPSLLLLAGTLAALFVVNQHVITGRNLEFSSHYWMPAAFWFAFSAAYLFRLTGLTRSPLFAPLAAGAMAAAFTVVAVRLPLRDVLNPPPQEWLTRNRYEPAFSWIRAYVPADAVIYASPELSSWIPIYTSANVYFAGQARFFWVPNAEVLERFLIAHFFDPITPEFVARHIREIYGVEFADIAGHNRQINRVRSLFGLQPFAVDPVPEHAIGRVLDRSRELGQEGFERALKRYRAEYIVWDAAAEPGRPYDALAFLERAAEIDGFRIYRVRELP